MNEKDKVLCERLRFIIAECVQELLDHNGSDDASLKIALRAADEARRVERSPLEFTDTCQSDAFVEAMDMGSRGRLLQSCVAALPEEYADRRYRNGCRRRKS